MADQQTTVNYKALMMRHKASFIGIAALCILGSIALAYGLTPIYRSQARILVDQGVMSNELIQTTVVGYEQERIYITHQRVIADENLDAIIEEWKPYPQIEGDFSKRRNLRQDIYLEIEEPEDGTVSFRIEYENPDVEIAYRVAREFTQLYLAENLNSRTEAASETSRFLEAEANKLVEEIAQAEQRIARFKEENAGSLPEQAGLNTQRLDRTVAQMEAVQREIRTLQERRNLLEVELRNVSPSATVYNAEGLPMLNAEERLRLLESEFLSLSAIYAPDHPDLIRLKREIDTLNPTGGGSTLRAGLEQALARQQAELAATLQRYSSDHPDVRRLQRAIETTEAELAALPPDLNGGAPVPIQAADNPIYVQLSVQLEGVETELAALRTSYNELQDRADLYEDRLAMTPQVEQDLLSLTRGYEQSLDKFDEIRNMQTEAEWAVALETEQKGDRFSLLEAPQRATMPSRPNRAALIFLGIFLGLGGGILFVALSESHDKSVRNKRDLVELIGVPPIATIPVMATIADKRRSILKKSAYATVLVIGLAITTSIVMQNYGTN